MGTPPSLALHCAKQRISSYTSYNSWGVHEVYLLVLVKIHLFSRSFNVADVGCLYSYTTEGLYAHNSNLEVIRIYLDPMLMSLFLSGHFLVVLPHQFFCLLVKECVQLIFHQNMNETINSFVDFAIHAVRIVLELVVEAKKIILEFHHVLTNYCKHTFEFACLCLRQNDRISCSTLPIFLK